MEYHLNEDIDTNVVKDDFLIKTQPASLRNIDDSLRLLSHM